MSSTTATTIPYVTRRDNELPSQVPVNWYYVNDPILGWVLHIDEAYRDEHGWLWQFGANDPVGRPQWKQVHAARHRECMDNMLCQVCAEPADRWLLPAYDYKDGIALTSHAPLCARCVPVARRLCPHLKRADPPWRLFRARRRRIAGVIGDYHQYPSGQKRAEGVFTKVDERWPQVLARQRLMRLGGLEEIDLGRGVEDARKAWVREDGLLDG